MVFGCRKAEEPAATLEVSPSGGAQQAAVEPAELEPTEAPESAADTPSEAAEATKQPAADTSSASDFVVSTGRSHVDFVMKAPVEHIHGVAKRSVHGGLRIDPTDISKTSGQIRIDLDKLELFQAVLDEDTGKFTEETKNAKQNAHMKTWFQISKDAPAKMREANRWITLKVNKISKPSANDVTQLQGDARKIKATVEGNFTLHGRTEPKKAAVQATFNYKGDALQSVSIRSVRPVSVSLTQHDIQPRSAFDKLAQKTLAALGQKVADTAPVTFRFTLLPK